MSLYSSFSSSEKRIESPEGTVSSRRMESSTSKPDEHENERRGSENQKGRSLMFEENTRKDSRREKWNGTHIPFGSTKGLIGSKTMRNNFS
jgi:hypothetical protein